MTIFRQLVREMLAAPDSSLEGAERAFHRRDYADATQMLKALKGGREASWRARELAGMIEDIERGFQNHDEVARYFDEMKGHMGRPELPPHIR